MIKLLNLTSNNKIIYENFSYEGKLVTIVNSKREEINKIYKAPTIFGRIDTEQFMDNLPPLSEIAEACCDSSYHGILTGICDDGFDNISSYHESFGYKCSEIISNYCNRKRLKTFIGIRHINVYILVHAPIRVEILTL